MKNHLGVSLLQGFLFPALHALVAHWAPPEEKGKFVSALLGGAIGTVVTWSLTGPLIENFGWDYAFYVPGNYFNFIIYLYPIVTKSNALIFKIKMN
jgi:MFS transporter, ACS family, solute carrier family 17 (sodium-dependent inorganic phosphate cotransporter), other